MRKFDAFDLGSVRERSKTDVIVASTVDVEHQGFEAIHNERLGIELDDKLRFESPFNDLDSF
jgi:hypothetical protein